MRPLIDGRALHHQEEAVPVIEQLDRLLLLLWVVLVVMAVLEVVVVARAP